MANIPVSELSLPNNDNNYKILSHGLTNEFVITGGTGWYKFFDITSPGGTVNLTILIEDTYSLATEILCVYFNQTGSGSSAVWNTNCKIMCQTQTYHTIKYILNNNNLTLYINKTTTSTGRIVFKLLNSTLRNDQFFDCSSYWTSVQTTESALDNAENANICLIPVSQKGAANGVASLNENGKVPSSQLDLSGKQDKITANGILKGNGQGGVTAATVGTDYGTYSKPSDGIPASDLAAGVIPSVPSAYTSNPAMDGTASPGSSTSWAKGDHVHPHDTTKADVVDLPFPSGPDDFPLMDGTAAVGSMDEYARADHVHPSDTTKANQAQLAVVESGSTASVAHAVGEYFCWNGLLYRATAAISVGHGFTPGTNCESTTIGTELQNLQLKKFEITPGKKLTIGVNYPYVVVPFLVATSGARAQLDSLHYSVIRGSADPTSINVNYSFNQTIIAGTSATTSLSTSGFTITNNNTTQSLFTHILILDSKESVTFTIE